MPLAATRVHLGVEMEAEAENAYRYIETVFELNKRYGWSMSIVMAPSIAIREGAYRSLRITVDHFTASYGKKALFFIYNIRRSRKPESFSSDAGFNVMVIDIRAFNVLGVDNRRVYRKLDDFRSRKPIDVIASKRSSLILGEPQKMQATLHFRRFSAPFLRLPNRSNCPNFARCGMLKDDANSGPETA